MPTPEDNSKEPAESKNEDDAKAHNARPKGFWQTILEFWRSVPDIIKAVTALLVAYTAYLAATHKTPDAPPVEAARPATSVDPECAKPIEDRPFKCRAKE